MFFTRFCVLCTLPAFIYPDLEQHMYFGRLFFRQAKLFVESPHTFENGRKFISIAHLMSTVSVSVVIPFKLRIITELDVNNSVDHSSIN